MTDDAIEQLARALGISIAPEWMPTVRAHLDIMLQMAGTVLEHPLPDEAEPAPVFRA